MSIRFGPSGIGSVKDAVKILELYSSLGLKACEIEFTYGVYIKKREDAIKIREASRKLGIRLSIHAPYWINLNSKDKEKIKKSKERILNCCKVGTWLGAKVVVFHPGFYVGDSKEEAYENIKNNILDIKKKIKKLKYTPKLAPEIMGKVNVFGSIEEISKLVEDTNVSFCIDFAHVLARYKTYNFGLIKKKFGKYIDWHVHFSGIVYNEKGEKNHIRPSDKELKEVILNLPKNKNVTMISESPMPVEDSLRGLKICKRLFSTKCLNR